MATRLLYMEDFDVIACTANVSDIKTTEDGRTAVILDQTCFYPRGGGQDWDKGLIGDNFNVEETRLNPDGVVWHIGQGTVQKGASVECEVDKSRRNVNTRLHSAGHVLDMAMSVLENDLIPGKGAHYPHMSFVEYQGSIETPDELMKTLQAKIDETMAAKVTNTLQFVSADELKNLCRHVPDNLPSNKPIRVVLYGSFGVPCGGTHVRKLNDIGKIEITKVKSKKGVTKISYRVGGIN